VVTVESLDSRKLLDKLSNCQIFRDLVAGQQTGCTQRAHQVCWTWSMIPHTIQQCVIEATG